MEKVKILGIDPSLRNTGFCVLSYNTEKEIFKVELCEFFRNSYKEGKEAIIHMAKLINSSKNLEIYRNVDKVIIESPNAIFGQNFASGTLMGVAHISGVCMNLFDLEKCILVAPGVWNKSKKKNFTHAETEKILGNWQEWNFSESLKNEDHAEHILDAASIALWYIKKFYIETEEKKESTKKRRISKKAS